MSFAQKIQSTNRSVNYGSDGFLCRAICKSFLIFHLHEIASRLDGCLATIWKDDHMKD
jgi:hypothetical protein